MTPKMRDRGLIALEMRLKGDTYANIGRVLLSIGLVEIVTAKEQLHN